MVDSRPCTARGAATLAAHSRQQRPTSSAASAMKRTASIPAPGSLQSAQVPLWHSVSDACRLFLSVTQASFSTRQASLAPVQVASWLRRLLIVFVWVATFALHVAAWPQGELGGGEVRGMSGTGSCGDGSGRTGEVALWRLVCSLAQHSTAQHSTAQRSAAHRRPQHSQARLYGSISSKAPASQPTPTKLVERGLLGYVGSGQVLLCLSQESTGSIARLLELRQLRRDLGLILRAGIQLVAGR